jgi:Domain of Unknown Function (DUF1080)
MLCRSITCVAILLSGWTALSAEKVFDFREDKLNTQPRGFRSAVTGEGTPGEWKVVQDDVPSLMPALTPQAQPLGRRPVLAQVARDRTDEHFPVLLYEDETFNDFTLSTRFKLVEGEEEQMAGIAFRAQDEKNYYYIRASGRGSTFHFVKVVEGQRHRPIGPSVSIPTGQWHQMTIECKGTRIRALLNGQELIPPLYDPTFVSGKIGYWTKSDSVSYFTDTVITYKPRETLAQILVRDAYQRYPRLLGLLIYAPPAESGPMQVVASLDPAEVGQEAPEEVQDVLHKQGYYYGKGGGKVMLTLPLRDNNGEKVAAVRLVMKSFPGQTEKNAVARAMPIVHGMESRIQTLKDLMQ